MQGPKKSQQLSLRQQQWRNEQDQFEASGLTARKFCELHRFNASTCYKRREQLAALRADNVVAACQKVATFSGAGALESSVKPR